jgi:hypothetical protein
MDPLSAEYWWDFSLASWDLVRRDIFRKRNRKKDETDTQTERKFKNTVASLTIKQIQKQKECSLYLQR